MIPPILIISQAILVLFKIEGIIDNSWPVIFIPSLIISIIGIWELKKNGL